ncbi:MAG: transporter substrate-binding domain-containing protein [Sulfuricurvum sp.]|nr:transporter substrate-binding domain-containing protein [Sulfuricurvum sp.]
MKKLIFASVVLSAMLFANTQTTLRVGIYDNPPKIYQDETNIPKGFYVDLLEEIAKKENWQLSYVPCEWNNCLEMVEKKQLDILPDVAYSDERAQKIKFNHEVVLSTWSVVYGRESSGIDSLLDLNHKRIAMLNGSIQIQKLRESFKLFEISAQIVPTESFKESFELLQKGKVDAAIVNRYFGMKNASQYGLKNTSVIFDPAALKFAFPKIENNEKLIAAIDKHIHQMKADRASHYYALIQKDLKVIEPLTLPVWFQRLVWGTIALIIGLGIIVLMFKRMLNQKTIEVIRSAKRMKQLESDKVEDYKKILHTMISLIEHRDSYTAGHSERVAIYSKKIAEEMGYSAKECDLLFEAAILHDIGKLAIPDAVLLKPDKLTATEYHIIQEHVSIGYKILEETPMFQQMADIIRHHHERFNGTGYPDGIKGDEIPPLSRIMIVADAFDAMTTNRIYKHKKSISEALDELESLKRSFYHPEVVDAAKEALKEIHIDDAINQTPKTAMEEQRFAYFYKDPVSSLYNSKYLEELLSTSSLESFYSHILIVSLHNFSEYNNQRGWDAGNHFLKETAILLEQLFPQSILFRLHANDFVIFTSAIDFQKEAETIKTFMETDGIAYDLRSVDLQNSAFPSYIELKRLILKN